MAARIKHIALSTDDPPKTAEFYKNAFGLTELFRVPRDTGAEGVWMTDGYIYFAVLKYGSVRAENMGKGPSTVPGFHHLGFHVDDMNAACAAVEAADGKHYPAEESLVPPWKRNSPEAIEERNRNRRYMGPEGLMIDVRPRGWGWDEVIKKHTQLYELTPASAEKRKA